MNDKNDTENAEASGVASSAMLEDMVQSVFITLDDGSVAQFTGRAVCAIGDTRTISRIQFGEPKKLPDGCTFETL